MKESRKRLVDRSRARAEATKPLGFRPARKGADRVDAALGVGEEIETLAVAPGVARERLRAMQAHMIGKRRASLVEDLLEDPAHREDRRAGVEAQAARLDFANLAARRIGALDHRHV